MKIIFVILTFLNMSLVDAGECLKSLNELQNNSIWLTDAEMRLRSWKFNIRTKKFDLVKEMMVQKGMRALFQIFQPFPENETVYLIYHSYCLTDDYICRFIYKKNPLTKCIDLHSVPNIGNMLTLEYRKSGRIYKSLKLKYANSNFYTVERDGLTNLPALVLQDF